jgi:hypothetical protein
MLDQLKGLGRRVEAALRDGAEYQEASLAPLRGATAQLLLATGAGAALEHTLNPDPAPADQRWRNIPTPLTWAPALLGSLAAAAQIRHARQPSEDTATALDILNASSIAVGGALFVLDLLSSRPESRRRMAPIAFASAGLLGLVISRQEREIRSVEESLRRRADVVERLVPRRRAKVEKIVVHV